MSVRPLAANHFWLDTFGQARSQAHQVQRQGAIEYRLIYCHCSMRLPM